MKDIKTKLTDISFGKRIQKYFKDLNLITVEDVVNFPIEDLVKIKGIGRSRINPLYLGPAIIRPHRTIKAIPGGGANFALS